MIATKDLADVGQLFDQLRHRIITVTEFTRRLHDMKIIVQSIQPAYAGDTATNEFLSQLLANGPRLGLTIKILPVDDDCLADHESCNVIVVII